MISPQAFAPQAADINALTGQLQNPFNQAVVEGVGTEFDRLRAGAAQDVQQQATAAGAFGGSRHGVAEAERMRNLDQQQAQIQAGLLSQGFQQAQGAAIPLAQQQAMAPAQAAMMQNALLSGALGPVGQVSTGTGTTTGSQTGQQFGSSAGTQAGTASNFGLTSGQQFGQQSGQASGSSQMSGRTVTETPGDLFGDILGLGQLAGSFFLPLPA